MDDLFQPELASIYGMQRRHGNWKLVNTLHGVMPVSVVRHGLPGFDNPRGDAELAGDLLCAAFQLLVNGILGKRMAAQTGAKQND